MRRVGGASPPDLQQRRALAAGAAYRPSLSPCLCALAKLGQKHGVSPHLAPSPRWTSELRRGDVFYLDRVSIRLEARAAPIAARSHSFPRDPSL